MKRPALQNKRVEVLRLAFRAQKVFGTFEKQAPEQDSNQDPCDASAMLYQLRYQANWELVIMRVHDNPVDTCINIRVN